MKARLGLDEPVEEPSPVIMRRLFFFLCRRDPEGIKDRGSRKNITWGREESSEKKKRAKGLCFTLIILFELRALSPAGDWLKA